MSSADGIKAVRLVIDHAQEVPGSAGASEGGPPEAPERDAGLPEGCPVEPLGVTGTIRHYLDERKQLISMPARDHSRLGVLGLFGRRHELLYEFWPRHNKEGNVTGWRPEKAAEELMAAAARQGVWDPFERVRGAGAWEGEDASLILHAGDALIVNGRTQPPGRIGRHVYPASAPGPRPAREPQIAGEKGPAHALLEILRTWNWRRGETDAQLLLGWIGAAMLGGALDWRPLAWITGDRFTGKSTLQKLMLRVFDESILAVSDASAAGIWQKIGYASLPVALDEVEAEEDNRRANNVIKLARQAASGGVVLRGGADHSGAEFKARSCFLFSSILVPPLLGQDRSRMAILELQELAKDAKLPALEPERLVTIGRALRRRLVDGWPRLADTIEAYRQALIAAGHSARGADQFGTLLACADVMLHDHPPSSEELAEWGERLKASDLAERDDDAADHQRCLNHLLTWVADVYRSGAQKTLGTWIELATDWTTTTLDEAPSLSEARNVLGTYGLKVFEEKGRHWLAVANDHQGLARVYAGTHWAGRSGASGVWVQALRRVKDARAHSGLRFAGLNVRCTLLPLEAVVPQPGADPSGEGLDAF